ncbi:MAG: Dabb family protein [Gemmatales bacterium]|nr:Dabb family protein [Gemmatales bacterium]MDW7993099.1 Dabb family protein [Gemmatales bacterium]
MTPWLRQALLAGIAFVAGVLVTRLWPSAERGPLDDRLYAQEQQPATWLVHNVYFSLKDNTPQARAQLVEACHKYLSGHEGTVFYAAGILAEDLNRPVNDRDFDVALHIVFKDKAAHDRYQEHPRHKKFIEENERLWKKVRVFDSYASPKR